MKIKGEETGKRKGRDRRVDEGVEKAEDDAGEAVVADDARWTVDDNWNAQELPDAQGNNVDLNGITDSRGFLPNGPSSDNYESFELVTPACCEDNYYSLDGHWQCEYASTARVVGTN